MSANSPSSNNGRSRAGIPATDPDESLISMMINAAAAMKITLDSQDGLYLHKLVAPDRTAVFEGMFQIWDKQPGSRGPYVNIDCRDRQGNTVLHYAAAVGDASLVSLLIRKGAAVNAKCNQGRAPLHKAALNSSPGVIEVLLEAGAEIDACSNAGLSALAYAAQSGKLDNVKTLLSADADSDCLEVYRNQLLHFAVAAGDVEFTTMACLDDEWDQNEVQNLSGDDRRYMETLRLSMMSGVSMQFADNSGSSAIQIAATMGYAEALKIILKPGPGIETLANEKHILSGKAPLHFAIEANHEAVIDVLLEADADPLQPDGQGVTPLLLSATLESPSIFGKLLEKSSIATLNPCDRSVDFASFLFENEGFSARSPVLVPLLCYDEIEEDDYRGAKWIDYHARKGWILNENMDFVRADGSMHTKKELSTFLQSWLFFGLLQAIFDLSGVKLNWRKLVYQREDDPETLGVTLRHLPYYLHEWSLKCHSQSKEVLSFVDVILRTASTSFATSFMFRDPELNARLSAKGNYLRKPMSERVVPEVALSIFILGEMLMGYRHDMRDKRAERLEANHQKSRHLYGLDYAPAQPAQSRKDLDEWDRPFLQSPAVTYDMMRAKGWCESDATILHTFGLGPTALYYMSRLERKGAVADHAGCTTYQCKIHNIDNCTYETHHVSPCSDCNMIQVDVAKVTSIVMSGDTPVIQISVSGPPDDQRFHLEVHPASKSSQYVAISHVWADGLGNPHFNALPKCQLFRLKALLDGVAAKVEQPSNIDAQKENDSSTSLCFWLDTLCIPLETSVRSRALGLLSNVYRNAYATLVLENELMSFSSTTSKTELLARIIMSTWMRRLWTYEEAILSKQLIFQFQDACLYYRDELCDVEPDHSSDLSVRQLHYSIVNCLYGAIPMTWDTSRRYELHRLNTLTLALASRTTSNKEDEFKCLGSLLELDVESIAKARSEDRPYVFYNQLGDKNASNPGLSPSILFAGGPRLTRPGFRWAPQSFLGRKPKTIFDLRFGRVRTEDYSSHMLEDYAAGIGLLTRETDDTDRVAGLEPAFCTKRGLHTKLAAWILDLSPTASLETRFAIKDTASDMMYMIWQTDLEGNRMKEIPSDRGKLVMLHHAAFSPWAVLIAVPTISTNFFSQSIFSSLKLGSKSPLYGIYLGQVRFTTWKPLPALKGSTQKPPMPAFYCKAKKSDVEEWYID